MDSFRPVKSCERTLQVLEALAESDGYSSLAELGRQLRIPKSSLHGLLQTMELRGWIVVDGRGGGYRLGVQALYVGGTYLEADDDFDRMQPVLDWLSEETKETVHLGQLHRGDIIYLAKRESAHPLRLFSAVGRRLPAHATALGKAVLAQLGGGEQLQGMIEPPLRRLTNSTVVDPSALQADLETTRDRGYAVDNEESTEGVRCLAVALKKGAGPASSGISFSIPVSRMSAHREQELVALLFAARDWSEQR